MSTNQSVRLMSTNHSVRLMSTNHNVRLMSTNHSVRLMSTNHNVRLMSTNHSVRLMSTNHSVRLIPKYPLPLTVNLTLSLLMCIYGRDFLLGILLLKPCISLTYARKTNKYTNYSFSLLCMVAPTCFGITLPSSGSVPSAF